MRRGFWFGKRGSGLNSTVKRLLISVLTLTCLVAGWRFVTLNMGANHNQSISLSQMQNDVQANKVSEVTVNGTEVSGKYKDSKETFSTMIPSNYPELYKDLQVHGVNVTIKDQQGSQWISILLNIAPIIVIMALFVVIVALLWRIVGRGPRESVVGGKS
jgi:cell division protease FtsH